MPVSFKGNYLIPAPFVVFSKGFNTTEDGRIVGTTYDITIKGDLPSTKGSPKSDQSWWTTTGYPPDEALNPNQFLTSIFRKQEALRSLFSTANDGGALSFTTWDGTGNPINCNPRIKKIEFQEGNFINTCKYVIQLEADVLYLNGGSTIDDAGDPLNFKISKASEDWNLEPGDDKARFFRLTHSLSAQGKRFFSSSGTLDNSAYLNAKNYCLNAIGQGIDDTIVASTGVFNFSSMSAYNYVRTQHDNILGGAFQVTESWILYDPGSGNPPALENYTVNIKTEDNGLTSVSCEGSLQGYQVSNNSTYAVLSSRYNNASGQFYLNVRPNIFSRCQTAAGLTLNPTALSLSESHNILNGEISYSQQYNNRCIPVTSGARSEIISLQDDNAGDVFAMIPVLGRPLGPVFQDISTKTPRRRNISIEILMGQSTIQASAVRPNTDSLVLSFKPASPSGIFLESDKIGWTDRNGRYTRNTVYTWEA